MKVSVETSLVDITNFMMSSRNIAGLLVLGSLMAAPGAQAETVKERVAILQFSDKNLPVSGLGVLAESHFSDLMVKLKRFEVVERAALSAVMKEQRLELTGVVDASTAVEVGKILGVDYIVLGQVTQGSVSRTKAVQRRKDKPDVPIWKIRGSSAISYRFISVKDASIAATGRGSGAYAREEPRSGKGSSKSTGWMALAEAVAKKGSKETPTDDNVAHRDLVESALQDAVRRVRFEIYNAFPITGYVIEIQDEKKRYCRVDVGTGLGVKKGDKYEVIIRGKDIIHPVTKKKMAGKRTVLGNLKIIEVDEQMSVAKYDRKLKGKIKIGSVIEARKRKKGFFERY